MYVSARYFNKRLSLRLLTFLGVEYERMRQLPFQTLRGSHIVDEKWLSNWQDTNNEICTKASKLQQVRMKEHIFFQN